MKNSLDLNEEKLEVFADAAVQYNIEKQLRSRYDKILADNKQKSHKKQTLLQFSTFAKIAAAFVAIIGCIFLMKELPISPSAQTTAQNLLEQTYISGNPNITRKGLTSASQLRREANDAFTLKNYPIAIAKYKSLKTQNEITPLDRFYFGISHLKTDNFSDAIELFTDIRSNNKIATEEVDWLLSLAYVLSNQEKKAIPLLEKIISENRYKSKEAKGLLNAID